jgi:hypothetical protein
MMRMPNVDERLPAAFAPPSSPYQQSLLVAGREMSARIKAFPVKH